jgi:hypothetical protein
MTLRSGDLKDLIYHIFEIDSYKSKMGSDQEIITISFSVKTKEAADDLESFLEKGYTFILDADATSGEQSDGTYKVFVEIERDKKAVDQILEIADGVYKISNIDQLKFRYYKNWRSIDLNKENLEQTVSLDSDSYGLTVNESNLNNYKNFFNKSFVESVDMWDDIIRIKKSYAEPVYFTFIDFGKTVSIKNNLKESLDINGFSEIIYLSKYIGDYNITKYGDKIVMENQDYSVVLKRIQT